MTDNPGADSMEKRPVQNDASPPIPTQELIVQQESDPELTSLWQEVLCDDEAAKVPTCYL